MQQTLLQSEYLSVLEAKTQESLLAELVRFAGQMGFLTISATAVMDRAAGEPDFITIDNSPLGLPRDRRQARRRQARSGDAAPQAQERAHPLGQHTWEVGRILGIAENTVVRHAHHATQKLGCTSKHHAAVKALRVGLIC